MMGSAGASSRAAMGDTGFRFSSSPSPSLESDDDDMRDVNNIRCPPPPPRIDDAVLSSDAAVVDVDVPRGDKDVNDDKDG
mmetsp:Transcript_29399/g.70925  ORF Transcript_29399/g.70925 Transcript_29399/m.70925 type:complete len:80 (-) Transcript_29399:235-474(-)